MMIKKFIIVLLAAVLTFVAAFAFAACGAGTPEDPDDPTEQTDPDDPGETETDTVTVTFDLNYDGGETETVEVEEGSTVERPEDPEREGYVFAGIWTTDDAGTNIFDFSTPITEDITLYAVWFSEDADIVSLTMVYGYDGASDSVIYVESGSRASSVTPVRDGYEFFGWYTDEELTESFSFTTRLTENTTIYAKWGELVTFEAEDTYVMDMNGPGWSGGSYGKSMIVYAYADRNGVKPSASNDFYMSFLYAAYDEANYNTTITFVVNSSARVENAVMYMRLASEAEFYLSSDEYKVIVNADENLENGTEYAYSEISFTDTGVFDSDLNSLVCDFDDYLVTTALTLEEGENTISLVVDNDIVVGGTLQAKAPVVDAIKIASADSELSWGEGYPYTDNYDLDNV